MGARTGVGQDWEERRQTDMLGPGGGRGVGLGGGAGLGGDTAGVLERLRKAWGYIILRETWINNFTSCWNWA